VTLKPTPTGFLFRFHTAAKVNTQQWVFIEGPPKDSFNDHGEIRLLFEAAPKLDPTNYIEGVNIKRLQYCLTQMGISSPVSQEELGAGLADAVNNLTRGVEAHWAKINDKRS
jgi:hypothetical protein